MQKAAALKRDGFWAYGTPQVSCINSLIIRIGCQEKYRRYTLDLNSASIFFAPNVFSTSPACSQARFSCSTP
jgi:hypothetical protein